MTNTTVHVLVSTCPYERIAEFGYKLRRFGEMRPNTGFSWAQVDDEDYPEAREADNGPNLEEHEEDVENYRGDPNWVLFAVQFREKADADAYRAWVEEGSPPQSHRPTCISDVPATHGAGDRIWTLQIRSDDPREPDAITHYATEKGAREARRELLVEWLAECFEAINDRRNAAELNDDELLAEWEAFEGERCIEIRCPYVRS